jgi:iron donor protein CyaY
LVAAGGVRGYALPMLTDTEFHALAQRTLTQLHDRFETAYDNAELEELELNQGVLTLQTATRRTFVVSAHHVNREIWLASPLSGGHHFRWSGEHWALPGGELLDILLKQELEREGVMS